MTQPLDRITEAKEELKPGSAPSEMFRHLIKNFGSMSSKERMALIGEIIFAATIAKILGIRGNNKSPKGPAAPPAPASEPERDAEEVHLKPDTENPTEAPEGLDGTKWCTENILKCENMNQCRQLMKANGFILDDASGNYINPNHLNSAAILNEPLVKAKIGDRELILKKSVMRRLRAADEAMFKETGEHIKVGEHFRTNSHQFELFKRLKPVKARVAKPGQSFHEIGQAIDVPENWQKAQKYLWAQGFVGGDRGLEDDRNHFSINEMKPRETKEEVD